MTIVIDRVLAYSRRASWVALGGLLGAAPPALAAGGHHAVDDAALVEPGQCQVETWLDRESGNARSLLHVGPACRIGAVEWGLSLDRLRVESGLGPTTTSILGAQIKLAHTLNDRWSVGVAFAIAGQHGSPGFLGSTILLPVTLQVAGDTLLAHFNVGRDFRHRRSDLSRAGLALEWTPLPSASFVAERNRENGANFWRLGARWLWTPTVNVDLSRAGGLHGSVPGWWTLGLTWVFDR